LTASISTGRRISEDGLFDELVAYVVEWSCHFPTFWVLIKVGVGNEQAVGSAGTGVEKSQDEGMKQGKTRLCCVAEHLLPVGVFLVALFWVIESLVEKLFSGNGTFLSMLLSAQPEQTWDHGLLAIVVFFFACYVQRGQGISDTDRYAAPRYSRLDYGVMSPVFPTTLVHTGSRATHEQGEAYCLRRPGYCKRTQLRVRRARQRGLVGDRQTPMVTGEATIPEEV